MRHKTRHMNIARLLFLSTAGIFILLCVLFVKADAACNGLQTGGVLPAAYTVNGIDVSGKSISDAREIIKNALGSGQIELCGTKINICEFTDIDVELSPEDIHVWSYLSGKGGHETTVTYKVDKQKLKKVLKDVDSTKTRNAKIRFKNGKAEIVPEVYGNVLKATDMIVAELERSLSDGTKLRLEQFYELPEITGTDLEKDLKKASKWDNYQLTAHIDGVPVYTFPMDRHLRWNGKRAVVSKKWLKREIKELATQLDSYGKTRSFVTSTGERIQLPGKTMGWLLNTEKTEKATLKAIKNKEKSIELVWDSKGAAIWDPETENDIGDTYVEVSISQQKVWYYKDGILELETSTVTGLPTPERQTKTGLHQILYKQRDRVLRGSRRAWHSFVNYWMPFTPDGQGLHDARWRRRFGGSIYKSSGSHGCVNLPASAAAQLYAKLETGTPVIVY